MVTTVSLAVLVSTNVRQELSLRARSIQSTLTCAQSAEHVQTYVRQRLSAWAKTFYLELQLGRSGASGPLFSCRLAVYFVLKRGKLPSQRASFVLRKMPFGIAKCRLLQAKRRHFWIVSKRFLSAYTMCDNVLLAVNIISKSQRFALKKSCIRRRQSSSSTPGVTVALGWRASGAKRVKPRFSSAAP